MDRRRFVLGLGGAAACPLCASLTGSAAFAAGDKPHWSYKGATGPENWGKLDASYKSCSAGTEQSPIDLTNARKAQIDPIAIKWKSVRLNAIANNGHTIQVNTPNAGHIDLDGTRYDLLQFHFHHKSEHTLDGRQFPLEVHFVHSASKGGGLAVIGVFFVEGDENAILKPIWSAAPKTKGKASSGATIDPRRLLPKSRGVFRYAGSLTTPPCSEVVAWSVYKQPVAMSKAQIADFATLFPGNFRPLQPVNRRFLLFSG